MVDRTSSSPSGRRYTYQGNPNPPPIPPEEFQRLLTSVAKAVLAKDGIKGLKEWEASLAERWG